MMADASGKCRADPALPAHSQSIVFRAMAVWNSWIPADELNLAIWKARNKLVEAVQPCRLVDGPAAATVATCMRLEWGTQDASTVMTDQGRKLGLAEDPPAVVNR